MVSHVQVIGVGRVFWGCEGAIQKKSIYLHVATVVADIENNLKNTALHEKVQAGSSTLKHKNFLSWKKAPPSSQR